MGTADPLTIRLIHIAKLVKDRTENRGVVGRNRGCIGCAGGIFTAKDPRRPRADFIMPDMRMQQRGDKGRLVVKLIIVPVIAGIIFDGVMQKPHPAAGIPYQFLHHTIFQKCRFKSSFRPTSLIDIWGS